jgi:hypothetical protein
MLLLPVVAAEAATVVQAVVVLAGIVQLVLLQLVHKGLTQLQSVVAALAGHQLL